MASLTCDINTFILAVIVILIVSFTDAIPSDYKGVMGYYYFDSGFKWIETDDGKQLKLKEDEFEFVD